MPRGRIKGDHEAKRGEIADAACKVFLRLGLVHTSLADIAREMGYTTGVLRHYFTDKDHLLLYIKNRLFDGMHRRAHETADGKQGLEKLRSMLIELLPADQESIDSFRLLAMFNGTAIGDAGLMKLQHKRNERHSTELAKVIEELRHDGIVRKGIPAKLEAAGLLALLDGIGEQQIMRPEPFTRDFMKTLMNRFIDSLVQPGRRTPRK